MSVEKERQAFIEHIKATPEDDVLRCAYSDWLEENDLPEEADRQRNWKQAKQWLTDLAARMGGTGSEMSEEEDYYGQYRVITYEDVIATGHTFVDEGEYFTQSGSEQARSVMSDLETKTKFWEYWQIMTGRSLEEMPEQEKKWAIEWDHGKPNPFSCSC